MGSKGFFGIQLKAYKIGDSVPAPFLEVMVRPKEIVLPSPDISDKGRAYQQFFTELLTEVRERFPSLSAKRRVLPQNWLSFPSGRTGFSLGMAFQQDGRLMAELNVHFMYENGFHILQESQAAIETEYGEPLSWETLPRSGRVAVYTNGHIPRVSGSVDRAKENGQ